MRASKAGGAWWALVVFALGFGIPAMGLAQVVFRYTLSASADSLALPRANLVPFSDTLRLDGQIVPRSAYRLDYFTGAFHWLRSRPVGAAVLSYRVFPPPAVVRVPLAGVVRGGAASGGPGAAAQPPLPAAGTAEGGAAGAPASGARAGEPLFEDVPKLERSGSIGRAVTVGTNRDLAVNSDFRLQLSGQLTDDLEIAAALTDENIPIQPSGNTQQLADFDRIFIQLKQRNRYLTFGDLETIQRGTSFANIYRNVQGLAYRQEGPNKVFATIANARGRFNTNTLVGENGRQGPYRLTGKDGERFMIVLAGSERVIVNGKRLTRGEGRDYVINYNTAEITFTPRVVMDANTRIVVDFEYLVQQYARSLAFVNYEGRLFNDRLGIRTTFGREADDPDAPLGTALDATSRQRLSDAGDSLSTVPAIDSVGYSSLEVRYQAVDTTINGQPVRFYRRSVEPSVAVYRLGFTLVGTRRGNYVRDAALVNGNVFRFVAPDAGGTPTGDYEPVRVLTPPRELLLGSVALDYRLTRRMSLFTESAVSSYDQNRLSARNDGDNIGTATRTGLRLTKLPLSENWSLGSELVGQYVDARFESFERVYKFEYGRDWNYNDAAPRGTERLAEFSAEVSNKSGYRIRTAAGTRSVGDSIRTQRLTLDLESTDSSAVLGKHSVVYLVTENPGTDTRSSWLRQNGDVFTLIGPRANPWLRAGSEVWLETRRQTRRDTLTVGSFDFVDLKPYLRSVPGQKLQFELASTLRTDREYLAGALREKSVTTKPSISIGYQPNQRFNVNLTTTFLNYRVRDTAFVRRGLTDQQALQSLLQTSYGSPNRFSLTSWFYEVSTERTARRQLVYVKVNAGLGQYEWIDYNKNGIEDLNEFELSVNPLTANYVRVLSPTVTLLPSVRVATGMNVRLDFNRVFRDGQAVLRHLLYNLSTQTNVRLDQRRDSPTDELQSYLVQLSPIRRADSTLLSATASFRQDLFFFRNNPIGDFAFSLISTQNLQYLNSGSEERSSTTWQARQRVNLSARHSLEQLAQLGTRRSRAQLLVPRNFDLDFWSVQPTYGFQVTRKVRVGSSIEYALRTVAPVGAERTDFTKSQLASVRWSLDGRVSFGQRNNLSTRVEWIENSLKGTVATSARFELLEGLQEGRNLVWNLMLVQYLSKILEFSLVYDGRASTRQPMIHSARIQLRALF
jgi:hypothetical protein